MRFSLFSVVAAAVLGCAPSHKESDFVLNIALPSKISTPDGRAKNGLATIVNEWLYEPLLQVGDDGSSQPALASVVEKLPGDRVRLRIRPGASFSDGSPVTIDDVRTSLGANNLGVEIAGADLLVGNSQHGVAPEAILPTITVSKTRDGRELGSGPFQIVEQSPEHLLLTRRIHTPGRINTIRLTSYDGPREAMARVLRGDANMLLVIESREVEFFEGVAHLKVVRGLDPHVVAIAMNPKLPLEDRLAIAHALPVAEMTGTVFGSECRPWPRSFSSGALRPGRPIRVLAQEADAELSRLGLAVRRSLADRGGDLQRLNSLSAINQMMSGDYDLATVSLLIWPVGIASLSFHSGGRLNLWGYSNAAVDAALEQGDWLKTLVALDQDPPMVFVCKRERIAIVDSRIKNPKLGPWGLLQTLPEWEVGE